VVDAHERRFGEEMFPRFSLDGRAGRLLSREGQPVNRQRQQPKIVTVRPVAAGRARAAIADAMEVVDGLSHRRCASLTGAFGERGLAARNVIDCPVTPNAARRIRVIAGAPTHSSGGERSSPSQVKRRGIGAPSTKEGEVSRMDRLR
jgi:hypothetical protein